MINYGEGRPPYIQLAAILRERIAAGEIEGRVPAEKALAQQYGVAIGTVRKAMAILRDEGLIYTIRGWGTFVSDDSGEP